MRRATIALLMLCISLLASTAPAVGGPPEPTAPGPPTNPLVTSSGCDPYIQYDLTWDPPASDGGSPITGYTFYDRGIVIAELGPDTYSYGAVGIAVLVDPTITASNEIGESEPASFGPGGNVPCTTTTAATVTEPTPVPESKVRPAVARRGAPSFTG
jgi:hypothetical protein